MTWILRIMLMCAALLAPIPYADTPGMLGRGTRIVSNSACGRNGLHHLRVGAAIGQGHSLPMLALTPHNPIRLTDLSGSIPDSVRLKMLAMILRGEVVEAGNYYLLATGASQLPKWFTAFQQAFDAASRVPNACQGVAKAIGEGFRQMGQSPQLIRIFSTGGDMLSWKGRQLVSDNNFHVAVLNGGRVFDAFTGSAGMAWTEYQAAMSYLGTLQYKVMP